jgi:hypothetical protein
MTGDDGEWKVRVKQDGRKVLWWDIPKAAVAGDLPTSEELISEFGKLLLNIISKLVSIFLRNESFHNLHN